LLFPRSKRSPQTAVLPRTTSTLTVRYEENLFFEISEA
jgi:hypothetical protein